MLKTRTMPTLLYRGSGLVKGVGFDAWRTVGAALQAVRVYNMRQVDELVFLDIDATRDGRPPDYALVDDQELIDSYARTQTSTDENEQRELHKAMQARMETEIVQGMLPIQKFDYTVSSSRVQDLYPSPIHQGRRLAEVWLSDQPETP